MRFDERFETWAIDFRCDVGETMKKKRVGGGVVHLEIDESATVEEEVSDFGEHIDCRI